MVWQMEAASINVRCQLVHVIVCLDMSWYIEPDASEKIVVTQRLTIVHQVGYVCFHGKVNLEGRDRGQLEGP